MSVINKVQLLGHLGQEPTIKSFSTGSKMASFSLATDEGYLSRDGKKIENTQWHKLVAWGDQVDDIEKQLHKGVKVRIEGKLANRSYQAKDGSTKYLTEVIVSRFELMPKSEKSESTAN